jgi:hypothetical protein
VNILLNGGILGTSTDADGYFALTVPSRTANDTLLASVIGFIPQRVPIGDKESLEISLKAERVRLVGVFVVGGITVRRWYAPRSIWYRIKRVFGRNRF